MSQALQRTSPSAVITGWDFSTTAVKCLAFDMSGKVLAEARVPTDIWTEGGVSELNLLQLEGQARATTRMIAERLRDLGRLKDWVAGGISATHHTAGRIDRDRAQVRRAICWNDQTLAPFYKAGLDRLGGPEAVRRLIGGPWAVRYSLSHLVKDEKTLSLKDWQRTWFMLPHGPLAAGFLTGVFDVTSVSSAASTGIMHLARCKWSRGMLDAIEDPRLRKLAWSQLPRIVPAEEAIGPLSEDLALQAGIDRARRPLIFPTSDDQQAGLVGGGAVDSGQMAIVLGTSAVVNSSSKRLPTNDSLDAMRLNWGPYLWMRCYSNGAEFVRKQIEDVAPRTSDGQLDWPKLDAMAREVPPLSNGARVLPFSNSEPSLGVNDAKIVWHPAEVPSSPGQRFRAAIEAIGYLIALGVRAHRDAGQRIERITISGGLARSQLMCEILATVLDMPLHRLVSDEGPALGAAVTALAAYETTRRLSTGRTSGKSSTKKSTTPEASSKSAARTEPKSATSKNSEPYTVGDAVAQLVQFRDKVEPRLDWREAYTTGLATFEQMLAQVAK